MKIKNFDNKEVEIIYAKIPNKHRAEGLCDDPCSDFPKILVDKDLLPRRQLNVLIEEVFHAYFFDLPEWKARKFAANLGKAIYGRFLKK
jgi:hypothetical protein